MNLMGVEIKSPTAREALLAFAFIACCIVVASAITVIAGEGLKVTKLHFAFTVGVIATLFGVTPTSLRNLCLLAAVGLPVFAILHLLGL